jgi:hypothetical protein
MVTDRLKFDLAAAVTPLSSRVTTVATKHTLSECCNQVDLILGLGACPEV